MGSIETPRPKQTENIFDLAKFIMAIMVVIIHAELKIFAPWVRIAVPLFFIMTGYFLFSKLKNIQEKKERKDAVIKFAIRNIKLYTFYSILLLPIVITGKITYFYDAFSSGILNGIWSIISFVFFRGIFFASWYIIATVYSVLIIFAISEKYGNKLLYIIAILFFTIACMESAYKWTFSDISLITNFYNGMYKIFSINTYNSLFIGVFWLTMGKFFAEHSIKIKKNILIISTILSVILLYCEFLFVKALSGRAWCDIYFSLIPISFFLFCILKEINTVKITTSFSLRKSSVIIYALHSTIISSLRTIWERLLGNPNNYILFFITLILCLIASFVILKLENKKYFKWLKYAH